MAVGGTTGKIGQAVSDVTDAHGMAGVPEELHDRAATGRVALLDEPEARLGNFVERILEFG
jgi:hypothetical protein